MITKKTWNWAKPEETKMIWKWVEPAVTVDHETLHHSAHQIIPQRGLSSLKGPHQWEWGWGSNPSHWAPLIFPQWPDQTPQWASAPGWIWPVEKCSGSCVTAGSGSESAVGSGLWSVAAWLKASWDLVLVLSQGWRCPHQRGRQWTVSHTEPAPTPHRQRSSF